jgi:hypothetical protein
VLGKQRLRVRVEEGVRVAPSPLVAPRTRRVRDSLPRVTNAQGPRVPERTSRVLARSFALATLVGAVTAIFGRACFALTTGVLALWPSLGGHFVEIAFLDGIAPRLARGRAVQAAARVVWWLAGGVLLGVAMIASSHAMGRVGPPWRWWWMGGPAFVALELVVHGLLALRRCANFYRGNG